VIRLRGLNLRARLALLVVLAVLVSILTAAALSAAALGGLSGLVQEQASAAVLREVEGRVLSRAEEQARAEDHSLERARSSAEAVAMYAAWVYGHPGYYPPFLQGGTPLRRTAQGHFVNEPDTLVGVFVPLAAAPGVAMWAEVGLMSFLDPLLIAARDANPQVLRSWVVSATGIVRMYPNERLGHPDSPVGPEHDFRLDEAYQAAAPGRNPTGRPTWTRPYVDPAGHGLMVTAVVPVYDEAGKMRAVCGLDLQLDQVVQEVLVARAGPGGYAFLLDGDGAVVTAPAQAYEDLGLAAIAPPGDPGGPGTGGQGGPGWGTGPGGGPGTGDGPGTGGQGGSGGGGPGAGGPTLPGGPGQASPVLLASSELPGVQAMAEAVAGAEAAGIVSYAGRGGDMYAGYAPLTSTGWLLVWALPANSVRGAASGLQQQLADMLGRLVVGLVAGVALIGGLMAVAGAGFSRSMTRPLAVLSDGARRLGEDPGYRLPDLGQDELGALARDLNEMADRLAETTATAVAAAAQAAAEKEAGALAVLEERNRLAREIHDTIAQGLAGVIIQLRNAAELVAAGDKAAAESVIAGATALAQASLADARRSVWSLRPEPLLEHGLAGALRIVAGNYAGAGFAVEVSDAGVPEGLALGGEAEDALFRVALEALANAYRHSGVKEAVVELRLIREETPDTAGGPGAAMRLIVSDRGRGIGAAGAVAGAGGGRGERDRGGFGIWAMRERLAAVGGRLDIESAAGHGTRVVAVVPARATGGGLGDAAESASGGEPPGEGTGI